MFEQIPKLLLVQQKKHTYNMSLENRESVSILEAISAMGWRP